MEDRCFRRESNFFLLPTYRISFRKIILNGDTQFRTTVAGVWASTAPEVVARKAGIRLVSGSTLARPGLHAIRADVLFLVPYWHYYGQRKVIHRFDFRLTHICSLGSVTEFSRIVPYPCPSSASENDLLEVIAADSNGVRSSNGALSAFLSDCRRSINSAANSGYQQPPQ